jgi:hypothetical protein
MFCFVFEKEKGSFWNRVLDGQLVNQAFKVLALQPTYDIWETL